MELQTVPDLREFFRDALHTALGRQHLHVQEHTEHYIVNLLAMFAHTDALFEPDSGRGQMKPLALILAEAVSEPDSRQRYRLLQRLGDYEAQLVGRPRFVPPGLGGRPPDPGEAKGGAME